MRLSFQDKGKTAGKHLHLQNWFNYYSCHDDRNVPHQSRDILISLVVSHRDSEWSYETSVDTEKKFSKDHHCSHHDNTDPIPCSIEGRASDQRS